MIIIESHLVDILKYYFGLLGGGGYCCCLKFNNRINIYLLHNHKIPL